MRIAVVGSRDWPSRPFVGRQLDAALKLFPEMRIVSGGAQGVDTWAEEWARARGVDCVVHEADWQQHGGRAGFIRNRFIIADADIVLAFLFNDSRGTNHSIGLALKSHKPVYVYERSA